MSSVKLVVPAATVCALPAASTWLADTLIDPSPSAATSPSVITTVCAAPLPVNTFVTDLDASLPFVKTTDTAAPFSPATVTDPAFASAAVDLSAPLTTASVGATGTTVSSVNVNAEEVGETKPLSEVSRNTTEFNPSTATKLARSDLNDFPSRLYCNPLGLTVEPDESLTIKAPLLVTRSFEMPESTFRLSESCDAPESRSFCGMSKRLDAVAMAALCWASAALCVAIAGTLAKTVVNVAALVKSSGVLLCLMVVASALNMAAPPPELDAETVDASNATVAAIFWYATSPLPANGS